MNAVSEIQEQVDSLLAGVVDPELQVQKLPLEARLRLQENVTQMLIAAVRFLLLELANRSS